MIRNFELFCKLKFIKKPVLSLLQESIDALPSIMSSLSCPLCSAKQGMSLHSHYERHFIDLNTDGVVVDQIINIPRLICSSCEHTHAYLPALITPFSSYSLFFVIQVLRDYFLRTKTVIDICENYLISCSTLYRWLELFRLHKRLWLGELENHIQEPLDFMVAIETYTDFLKHFFELCNRSFLQNTPSATLSDHRRY